VITCPIRFRQDWLITANAAKFFFGDHTAWTSLQEIKLRDKHGQSAGNIDVVIIAYDDDGQVTDFGSLEVQAVYISGNVRNIFKTYMKDRSVYLGTKWSGKIIRPDFLSSSRKRLLPQMLYKGGILKAWGKRQAVAIQKCFYETLPKLPTVGPQEADIAWFLYDLKPNGDASRLDLTLSDIIYTEFKPALDQITIAEPGDISHFMGVLQKKFNEENNNENPPDAPTLIEDIFE
jgi:hypothetical protein